MNESPPLPREPSQKALCVSHVKDVDGCVSAALVKCATESSFHLIDYNDMNKALRGISSRYNHVYVCDLGINKTTLEEFQRIRQFAHLTYLDHHLLDRDILPALQKMGVETVHDERECASVLTLTHLKKQLPREAGILAAYAAVSDRTESGPKSKKILRSFDHDLVLFESMQLSYALEKSDLSFKRMAVSQLATLAYPHQIEGLSKLALAHADRMAALRRELPQKASRLGELVYVEVKGDSTGGVANLLLDVCDASIGVGYKTNLQKQVADLSLRGKASLKTDLGELTYKLAVGLGGIGGGHPKASGARIPLPKLMEFIHALSSQ